MQIICVCQPRYKCHKEIHLFPWTDTPSDQADESLDRILAVLSKDRMARFKARAIEDMVGIKRTALYGKLHYRYV
jgi:hypothetical protein